MIGSEKCWNQKGGLKMRELLQGIYRPVVASPEFKLKLLKHLNYRIGAIAKGSAASPSRQERPVCLQLR